MRQALSTEVFNPGEAAIFAVSSVLVQGKKEAILIDAQFSAEQARKLADQIKATGKQLTTIYISHGDPDYYFGLDTLHAAFPAARIVATQQTIAHIKATKDEKLKVWGPKLGANAPRRIILPQPLKGNALKLEGNELKIVGLDGPTPDRTFVWIPSIKTVAGGIPVLAGEHVWMADTQTRESHTQWLATLDRIKALQPATVIPGHFAGTVPPGLDAVEFTGEYIRAFDEAAAKAGNSTELIAAMKARYPKLGGEASLELSAKVAMGEMQWK
nr:MBL fold metallo-hydrolase [uncultured Cupriavidus sp.]